MRARAERVEEPLRVLFVCTANISRSPYAERRAALMSTDTPDPDALHFASAGVPGFPGRGMDPEMAAQLRSRGGEPNGHTSRAVTAELLDTADLVITVTFAHRLRIAQSWPQHSSKVFGLHQLGDALGRVPADTGAGLAALDAALAVAAPDSLTWDIADPYQRGAAAAQVCADEIDETLAVIVSGLTGIPAVVQ